MSFSFKAALLALPTDHHLFAASGNRGQATVEAAFLIPVLLVGLLMLIQPGIVLYDRMVMHAAAAEGCRLLSTKPESEAQERYEAAVRRALGSVPQQDNFHVHGSSCSWEVVISGAEGKEAQVVIRNKLRPLPLFDAGAGLLGLVDGEGLLTIEVEARSSGWPEWVRGSSSGANPRGWIESWREPSR